MKRRIILLGALVIVIGVIFGVLKEDKQLAEDVIIDDDRYKEETVKPEVKKPEVKKRDKVQASTVLDVNAMEAGALVLKEQVKDEVLHSYFVSNEISDEILGRISGKSYSENEDIGVEQLRYLKVLHYNFDHQIQVGELIVNADLSEDVLGIFTELFEQEYEINSMYLIDNYWTGEGESSDAASIEVNNTSAFCYRRIVGGEGLSNHALGRAIDINPQQNPYVVYQGERPVWDHENASDYIDRGSNAEHMITHEDLCYQIFMKYGFTWGGDWESPKDYQHFEKLG